MSGARTGSPPSCGSTRSGSNNKSNGKGRPSRRVKEDEGRRKRPEVEHYKPPGAKKGGCEKKNGSVNPTPCATNSNANADPSSNGLLKYGNGEPKEKNDVQGGGAPNNGAPFKSKASKKRNHRKEKPPKKTETSGGIKNGHEGDSVPTEQTKKRATPPRSKPINGHPDSPTLRKSNRNNRKDASGDNHPPRDRRNWNGSRSSKSGHHDKSQVPRSKEVEKHHEEVIEYHHELSSRKTSLSSPTDSSKQSPLFRVEESLSERVNDWSLEVEMEDEKKKREKESERLRPRESHNNNARHVPPKQIRISPPSNKNAGGIIRIPSGGVESNNWRLRDEKINSSPAKEENDPYRRQSRVLYDPKNPNKHIPVRNNSGHPSMSRDHIPSQDFFPPSYNGVSSMVPPHSIDVSRLPHPHAPLNYQHPIPYGLSLRPNGPEWYDVFNSRIYGNDKHDINNISLIVRCDLRIYEITMHGSWELLSQLWDTEVAECRQNILKAFEELLKSDLVFCLKHNVEFHIWKIAFWNLTEVLKILLAKEESQELRSIIKSRISQLIDEGIEFYERALKLLDETYEIDLESYYDILKPRPSDKFQRCVLVTAQNCLICLGDLARYKEQVNESCNFGKTRHYYIKATSIETRNAKPFHMMAVLSNMAKRKLDAIYYHMRCLQCKNAFRTDQQSLTVIFEEFKKNWEANERKKIIDKERKLRNSEREKEGSHNLIKGTRLRNEIWIKSEGGRRLHRTTSARESETIDVEDIELMEMNSMDLCKRFITTFIYLLGKLFTYIDMDSFPLALEILQKEFRVLISRSPLPIDVKSLVQIMAMNMFIIEHTKMKNGDTHNYRSSMQNAALQLSFEMFGILIERCNQIFQKIIPEFQSGERSLLEDEDLSILLPPVKVWCDWMLGNNDTWYPVVSEDPFNQLAILATHLEKLKPLMRPVLSSFVCEDTSKENVQAYNLIKLEEDAILCGLTPWFRGMDWASYRRYYPKDASYSSKLAHEVRRYDAINFCVEFLEGLESPILKWSLPDNAHISLVENNELSSAVDKVNAKLSNMLACQQDILEESYSEDESDAKDVLDCDISIPNEEIRALKHRKEILERQRMAEEREMVNMQKKILADHVSVTLEIRPQYLVADTNCFVDHLDGIKALVASSQYHLRVPLVVLNELDGLSKGARPSKYSSQEHANMVSDNARRALNFLRNRPRNTKCVTSRGVVINYFGITSEEDPNYEKKNDDLILDICLNLSSNKEETKGNMRIVYRDVVLLTDDRNLKLKAHITDIPVNKFIDFFNWAKCS
ncbi:telomerase-binding protein EST1A [Lepeophtheirus salmonis]|uniref:Putative LOC100651950 [Bombus terrestris] n=1 Tax=Lepeophtheirus salmonis TaxID=72036 RepID=A0A0K2TG00_LEPSM|nr:telomerase-binding protein EST1A-like [Lepeophtheirus salmonis]